MLSTTLILERLYRVPRRTRRERFRQRLLEIQSKLGRWLQHQSWTLALASSSIVIFFLALGYYYNLLFSLERNVQTAWARVEAGQQRRNHISRNLKELLRFYARYERELMLDVTKMRSDSRKSDDANGDAMGLLGRLNMLAEQYPNLHLTNTVQQVTTGMINTESEIAAYIIGYNETVNIYSTAINTFPAKIFSTVLGFRPYRFYEPEHPSVLLYKELEL
jgi:LemA protein